MSNNNNKREGFRPRLFDDDDAPPFQPTPRKAVKSTTTSPRRPPQAAPESTRSVKSGGWQEELFIPGSAPRARNNPLSSSTQTPANPPRPQRPSSTASSEWQTGMFIPGSSVEMSQEDSFNKRQQRATESSDKVRERNERKIKKQELLRQNISAEAAVHYLSTPIVPAPFLTPKDEKSSSNVAEQVQVVPTSLDSFLSKSSQIQSRGSIKIAPGLSPHETGKMDALLSVGTHKTARGKQSAKELLSVQDHATGTRMDSTGKARSEGNISKPQSWEYQPSRAGSEGTYAFPSIENPVESQATTNLNSRPAFSALSSKSIMKDTSTRMKVPVEKKKKGIAWTDELFVVGADKITSAEIPTNGPLSENKKGGDDQPRSLTSLSKAKSMRIDDKDKRDMRWNWSQLLISKTFTPYRKMLAKDDDLLPDDDDFNIFEDSEDATKEKYDFVRDSMLENGELTEREIACFFEGFSLFAVKVRSLESQLESMKAVSRVANHDFEMRSMRMQSIVQSQSVGSGIATRNSIMKRAQSGKRDMLLLAHKSGSTSSDEGKMTRSTTALPDPVSFAQKSLRALSIKKIQTDHRGDDKVQKLLAELEEAEKKQKKLEKQLQQAGILIAEDIPFEEAKAEVARIAKRMEEIGSADVKHEDKKEQARLREEYFKLEQDMEKFNTALTLTDEWIEEQEEMEQKWEDNNAPENEEALKKLRRHMPVNVKSLSEAQLSSDFTPNGKVLPQAIARKFKRTNVLQLIRTNPDDLVRVHPSTLENLRVTGLTLTERRALYAHLLPVGPRWKAMQADQMTERKWNWYKTMKLNFTENLDSYQRHVASYGPPGNHPYATRDNPNEGCPLLGKQCPLKADKLIDYDNDYGYTDNAEFEESNVRKADSEDPGAKAMREAAEFAREKKAGLRGDLLKKHYKGKVLQVSLANGSCEAMDETMDKIDMWHTKWIGQRVSDSNEITDASVRKEMTAFTDALNELKLMVLQFAERSGMQLTGKKDANADQPDIRSPVELGLSEEVYEFADDFFKGIIERMAELKTKDGRMKLTIDQLRDLLVELHDRNVATLKELGIDRPEPSRKRKTRKEIEAEAKSKMQPEEHAIAVEALINDRPVGGPGRGGLMDAIAGRGRGPPGRGGLMDAIAGRGRGRDHGRGGLNAAIAARGERGGSIDLMAAIAARGTGREEQVHGGGRGSLMSAITARGGGRGNVRDTGGGDLMAAIKARGSAGRGNARDAGGGNLMAAINARGSAREAGIERHRNAAEESPASGSELRPRGSSGQGRAQDAGGGEFLAMVKARGGGGSGSFGSKGAIVAEGTAESLKDDGAVEVTQPSPSGRPIIGLQEGNVRSTPTGMGGLLAELQARNAAKEHAKK